MGTSKYSLNDLIYNAMFNLNDKKCIFLLVADDKPKITVDAYPVVSEEPLVVSDDCVKFFYKGKVIYRTYFVKKEIVSNKEVNPLLRRDYYKFTGNDMIIDLMDYKFVIIDLSLNKSPVFNKYTCPHNQLLDI